MIFGWDGKDNSLANEVRDAELRLIRRRTQLREDMHTMDVTIRKRVTSPDILLWSAGSGFIIGELTKKRTPAKPEQEKNHYEGGRRETDRPQEHEESAGTLQLMLRYIAIARPIIASVTDILGPFMHKAHAEAVAQDHENVVTGAEDPAPITQQTANQPA